MGKYRFKEVKSKDCKIKKTGSKTFEKRLVQIRECLDIANLVNSKAAKIIKYQPHGGQIIYDLLKELK